MTSEDLTDLDLGWFLCNTNRKWSKEALDSPLVLEHMMFDKEHAIAWTDFNYEEHMHEVEEDDLIIMWAKGVGAIGLGQATDSVHIVGPSGDRFFGGFDTPTEPADEWRIPVKWLIRVDDADAYPWHGEGMNFTFVRADNETWRTTAREAIQHLMKRQ